MSSSINPSLDTDAVNKLLPLAVVLLGTLVYANTFNAEFVWDDASSVLLHKNVQDPTKVLNLFTEDQHAFGRGQGNFYRPLVSLSFMFDFLLASDGSVGSDGYPALSPFFFHVTSLLWHLFATLSLLWVMTRLGAPTAVKAFVALVYVVHPLHTEAVAYISGRADSMSAAFMFAGIAFATWDETSRRRTFGIALSALCFVGALLSKESSYIFPGLLFLCLYCRHLSAPSENRKSLRLQLAPVALAAILLLVQIVLRTTVLSFGGESSGLSSSLITRIIETLQSMGLYVKLLFVPTGLHMERTLENVSTVTALAGFVLIGSSIAILTYGFANKHYRVALGLAWFLLTWLPISGLYPLNAPMAEHWMYVPMAGFFWALAEIVFPVIQKNQIACRTVQALAAVWIVFLIALSVERNLDWRDNETLFMATLQENPDSLRVRFNLAVVYEDIQKNRVGAIREYKILLDTFNEIVQENPELAQGLATTALESHIALGNMYLSQNNIDLAGRQFQQGLTTAPNADTAPLLAEAAMGMGQYYLRVGDRESAARQFQNAVTVRPEFAPYAQQLLPGISLPASPQ